jgi:hypothetical protein
VTPYASLSVAVKMPCLICKLAGVGKSALVYEASSECYLVLWTGELSDVWGQEKRRIEVTGNPYRQPTLVYWSSRLRRAGELLLRNSANQLGVR